MENSAQKQEPRNYYSKAQFWDQRYGEKGGFFDWYAQYPELKYCFQSQYGMNKDDSILMVGCGNSKLSQQMFEAGYKNIINIDISPAVIQQMKLHSPQMQWLVMDATQMTFQSNKFDYVIDKGTMDALIAGRDLTPTTKLLEECMRVTKQQGQLILITYGSPQGRKKIFQTSLAFNLFDYYFCYINLNDMSTMINLMRNNVIGPNGQQISKQEALQRSMKEFMMIKIMRQRRSKDKQFVIWQNYMKKQKIAESSIQPSKMQITLQKSQKQSNNNQTKQSNNEKQQQIPSKDAQANQNKQAQQSAPKISYLSKPQKQSYVYAYSVKRKFGYNFDFSLNNSQESTKAIYEGSPEMSTFQFKGSSQINKAIDNCVSYCQKRQISYSTIQCKRLQQKFSQNQKSIKINVSGGQGVKIKVLKKTNIQIKVSFTDLNIVMQKLKRIDNYLLQSMGILFHPCPKTFSLFAMLKNRMKAKSSNQLFKKYWYPTYKIKGIDVQSKQLKLIIAVPPVLPAYLNKIKDLLSKYFSIADEKSIDILSIRNGFITFPELNLFAILNMASLSHNKGKSLQVIMQDFSQNQKDYEQQGQSDLYIINQSHIQVEQSLLHLTILHIICLY